MTQSDYKYVTDGGDRLWNCPRCNYRGTAYHPRRDAPTYHATLRRICPTTDCNAELDDDDAD